MRPPSTPKALFVQSTQYGTCLGCSLSFLPHIPSPSGMIPVLLPAFLSLAYPLLPSSPLQSVGQPALSLLGTALLLQLHKCRNCCTHSENHGSADTTAELCCHGRCVGFHLSLWYNWQIPHSKPLSPSSQPSTSTAYLSHTFLHCLTSCATLLLVDTYLCQ